MKEESGRMLMISSDFPPVSGGQARYLYDLWSCLPPEEIAVLAPEIEGSRKVDAGLACRVRRIDLPLGNSRSAKVFKAFALLRAALALCRGSAIAGIHCGQLFSAGFAGLGCRLLRGVPYYPYVHGADLLEFRDRFFWGWLLKRILGRARRVVVNSRFTGAAVGACGVEEERILVVNPGIDPSRFEESIDRNRVRRERGWEGKKVILSLGRLVERKGQDAVIRALPRVAGEIGDVRYAIGGDGPHRNSLEELARREGVAERVEFLGFVPEEELPGLYAGADLFAMISREIAQVGEVEGFGIVYLEANAAGRAVIAGDSGGVRDAVVEGETGILVDPEDVDDVTRGLIELLRDDELRERLGCQGRERVLREFDRRKQAARLWEVCR